MTANLVESLVEPPSVEITGETDTCVPVADTPLRNASWIWCSESRSNKDRYACFRYTFELSDRDQEAFVDISADSDYVLCLNGEELGRGQFGDFATKKTWSRFPVGDLLANGENILAVWAYHRGEDFFEHQAGPGGIIVGLRSGDAEILSGPHWRAHEDTAFASRQVKMTFQAGYTFEYDARLSRDWQNRDFDDSDWSFANVIQEEGVSGRHWKELIPRPLPQLELRDLFLGVVVSQGLFFNDEKRSDLSPANAMGSDALRAESPGDVFDGEMPLTEAGCPGRPYLSESDAARTSLALRSPTQGATGRYFILDLGVEVAGLIEFELETSAGTIIDIGHGEHLDDGRVRVSSHQRQFGDRYICREGRQRFQMPFRRLAARYLEIHCTSSVRFYSLGLRSVEYPTQLRGSLQVDDPLTNRIREMAVRTLELCKHDHYEDCPWREQALYGFDVRFEALFDYASSGDYRFAEVSLELMGESLNDDGFLALTAPSRWPVTIPVFTFNWITAVAEHWLYSGESHLFGKFAATIEVILDAAFFRQDQRGLYVHPKGDAYWGFYEWTIESGGTLGGDTRHASYNLYLLEAIRSASWMFQQAGETDRANALTERCKSLTAAIDEFFWDGSCFRTEGSSTGTLNGAHELVQSLALCEGILDEERAADLVRRIMAQEFTPAMIGALYYLFRPLHDHSPESRRWVAEHLEDVWAKMAFSGASTLWEMRDAGVEFSHAGSLCHGFSCLPLHYYQTAILGITPLEPAFEQFSLKIYPYRFAHAGGRVPTPFGDIRISWRRSDSGLIVEAFGPSQCEPILSSFPEFPVVAATYNGIEVSDPVSLAQL